MPGRISPDGRTAYYSDPAEYRAAFDAYQGDGPYPALGPGPDVLSPGTRPGQVDRNVPGTAPSPSATSPVARVGGGGSVMTAPLVGAPTGVESRPWYMNYDNETLMAGLRQDPSMRSRLPASVIQGFPNEFFLQNPSFQDLLDPARRATFGMGALPDPTRRVGPSVTAPLVPATPATPATTPTVSTPARPGGFPIRDEQAGFILHPSAGLPSLVEPGKGQSPLPPGIARPIAGQRQEPYRTLGNLPRFAPQTLANMTSTERQALGVLANRTGNYEEDFFEQSRRLGEMPGGGGGFGGYAGAPRRRR